MVIVPDFGGNVNGGTRKRGVTDGFLIERRISGCAVNPTPLGAYTALGLIAIQLSGVYRATALLKSRQACLEACRRRVGSESEEGNGLVVIERYR